MCVQLVGVSVNQNNVMINFDRCQCMPHHHWLFIYAHSSSYLEETGRNIFRSLLFVTVVKMHCFYHRLLIEISFGPQIRL